MVLLASAHPQEARTLIREGQWTGPTAGLAQGYSQANLVILPQELAYEFLLFCQRNPKPCPLLEVTEVGRPQPVRLAPQADLRTDLPKYRIYRQGKLEAEVTDIKAYWREDLVAFLLGCSFTFEAALLAAGIPVRHLEEGCNVPMYITNIDCIPAGRLHGQMVVTMRPIPFSQVVKAVLVTARYPQVHGAPIHIGQPSAIGIENLAQPPFGDPVTVKEGETPVFWACGVTPQVVARQAKLELMITHAPGHMFITDIRDEELAEL
jgi:uncharacterized protein YcsI (UPF0317 family)